MNIQITRLAFGVKCGLPSGGAHVSAVTAAFPSRWSIDPSTSPVKPIPQSARNTRRLFEQQPGESATDFNGSRVENFIASSANCYKISVVHEHVDKVLARSQV